MPNTRISDLTAAASVAGTDVYPSVQTAGVGPVKTSLTQITAFALANAPTGAVAAPSIAPTGDTNTGFWFPAADTIAASTGGSERMRITSAGSVGIGTTSIPASALLALGTGNIVLTDLYSVGWGTQNTFIYGSSTTARIFLATNNVDRVTIDNVGNVGIGTTSPASRLDVSASNYVDPVLTISQSPITVGNKGVINFNDSTGTTGAIYSYGSAFGGGNNYALTFLTNTGSSLTEKMRITSAGNVGIGTTSPGTILEASRTVSNNIGPEIRLRNDAGTFLSGSRISFYDGLYERASIVMQVDAAAATGNIQFYTGFNPSTEKMRITSAGNVGIGTTSPAARLHSVIADGTSVLGLSGTSKGIRVETNSTSLVIRGVDNTLVTSYQPLGLGGTYLYFDTNGTIEAMRIDATGNVLVGTTSSPTTGTQCLTIETGTAPTATPADTVTFYSSDLSAGNTIPSIYTEGTGIVSANTGTTNLSNRIAVRINGTVYYLLAASSA